MTKPSSMERPLKVKEALLQWKQGVTEDYCEIARQLTHSDPDEEYMIQALKELRDCALILTQECHEFVAILFKVDVLSRENQSLVEHYSMFILGLLSAHTFYLEACLQMVVRKFVPAIELSPGDEVSDEIQHQHNILFHNVHSLLQDIYHYTPMAPPILLPLLWKYFPYVNKHVYIQECYVRNLFRVIAYIPKKRLNILELIINKVSKLDVQSPRHVIEELEEESENEEDEDDIFTMDKTADLYSSNLPMNEQLLREQRKLKNMTYGLVNSLDEIMAKLFNFVQDTCHPKGVFCWESTKLLYRDFLWLFDHIILPTHACCHVQFLMFKICSYREELAVGFVDYLWKKVRDPNVESVFRRVAVAYMASFLARATFISLRSITDFVETMCSWAHLYINEATYTTQPDAVRHGSFYGVCQAIFYIFSFRHKDILINKKGLKFAKSLNLQAIVTSRLNPLQMTLGIITKTFASIARGHQLAFCDTILERNRRLQLPEYGAVTVSFNNPLDSFFPFDPYVLKRSYEYIKDIYKEYDGTTLESDDSVEMEEESLYEDVPTSLSTADSWSHIHQSQSPTNGDFLMYGTSPGFMHIAP